MFRINKNSIKKFKNLSLLGKGVSFKNNIPIHYDEKVKMEVIPESSEMIEPKNFISSEYVKPLKVKKNTYSTLSALNTDEMSEQKAISLVTKKGIKAFRLLSENLQTEKVCQALVSKDGKHLAEIALGKRTFKVCLIAMNKRGSLKDVPLDYLNHKEIWLDPIKKDGFALLDIPVENRTEEMIVTAIDENYGIFKHLSEEEKTEAAYIQMIKCNMGYIKKIPAEKMTLKIAVTAVKFDSIYLQDIPHEFHEKVINQLGFEEVLTGNYSALSRDAVSEDNKSTWNEVLANTRYVLVTSEHHDYEVADFRYAYFKMVAAKGGAIHVYTRELKKLLDDLSQVNKNPVELILIDHCNPSNQDISGLTPKDVSSLAVEYSFIENIVLFGCNTVKAKKLNEDISPAPLDNEFGPLDADHGLILLSQKPNKESYDKLLNLVKLDKTYILSKEKHELHYDYHITLIGKAKNGLVVGKSDSLTEQEFMRLEKCVTNGKSLKFPLNNEKYLIRHAVNAMSDSELITFLGYSPHDNGSLHKHAIIGEDEEHKLNESFARKVIQQLKVDNKLNRDLSLTGYTKFIFMDYKNDQVIFHTRPLYHSSYNHPFFMLKKDPIDRHELARVRGAALLNKNKSTKDETGFDVLTVKIKKLK